MKPSLSRGPLWQPVSQTGVVLLSCLIFLTVLTLLGLSASADSILQNKLAANLKESGRAKQSALSALSWVEDWLLQHDDPVLEICSEPCDGFRIYAPGDLPSHPESEDFSWWQEYGYEAGIDPLTGNRTDTISVNSFNPPMWIIEVVHEQVPALEETADPQVWYRIKTRGTGHTKASVSVIESTVVRSWPAVSSTEPPDANGTSPCPASGSTGQCGRISWRVLR